MRTTLSLDDDVAALLKQEMRRSKKSLKEQVNDALRLGLSASAPRRTRTKTRTRSYDAGECLIGTTDNVADVLAVAEGETFK